MAWSKSGQRTQAASGDLTVAIDASYNLVVDSNVLSPSTYAPSVATVMGEFCNTTGGDLTNVMGFIGDFDAGTPANSTPGLYPVRSTSDTGWASEHPHLDTGHADYQFFHVGGSRGLADASRPIGDLSAGECRVQYWHFTYPRIENGSASGDNGGDDPTWGATNNPDDDLYLYFDIWATYDEDASDYPSATWKMTTRNEISAMANKIQPNPAGQWFNTSADTVLPGETITSNGILYELGNINKGFDNDGDMVPDYNAWLQPFGDPSYDPSCFRLIGVTGVLTVSRSGGLPDMFIPFNDQLYFSDLPQNNTGVVGEVHYEFMALNGPCSTGMTPYQEVASGFDNEKFNGDYGSGQPPLGSFAPAVTVTKSSAPDSIALGSTTTYNIPFQNTSGSASAGLSLSSGVFASLVMSDTVPSGMQYVGSSASSSVPVGNAVSMQYSTDSGATWSTSDPGTTLSSAGSMVVIRWVLNEPLGPTESGSASFQATVPVSYSGTPFIENCAGASFGDGAAFATACTITIVQGTLSIGDFVWRDLDLDSVQDGGSETGIDSISVSLYWDANGDGAMDAGDMLLDTTTTSGGGAYSFNNLPNGDFLVVVDESDTDLPQGYRHTTDPIYATTLSGTDDLDADFGFGPTLQLTKTFVGGGAYEGQEVTYVLTIQNLRPGGGVSVGSNACMYTVWATLEASQTSGQSASKQWNDQLNALSAGGPDGQYAHSDYTTASNGLAGTGFSIVPQAGNITAVNAVFSVYVDGTLSDDDAEGVLYYNGSSIATNNFTSAALNSFGTTPAAQGLMTWDVTSANPGGGWDFGDFTGDLDLEFESTKSGSRDGVAVYWDAMGFQITTDQACVTGDADDVIFTLPLTDTYESGLLTFVSASPTQDSHNPSWSASEGLLTWNNLGPLGPGQSTSVNAVFTAKEPVPATAADVADNSAGVTGAKFADGTDSNDDTAFASGPITPTTMISGTVFSDIDSDGWTTNTGYDTDSDTFIGGVTVVLFECVGFTGTQGNKDCGQNGGIWTAVMTTTTNVNGRYEFDSLLNGYYYVDVDTASIPGLNSQQADADEHTTHGCGSCSTTDSQWQGDVTFTNLNPMDSATGDRTDISFGYDINPSLYGIVWEDFDGDGVQDAGDNPISGVTVYLCTTLPCNSSNDIQSTTTDASGAYLFDTGIAAGTTYYTGVESGSAPLGTGWSNTVDPDGTPGDDDFDTGVTAAAGTAHGSYDYGYNQTGSSTIGDSVYVDWNGDGAQGAGEEGIPSVDVSLYHDTNGDGAIDPSSDALVDTTTTDASGNYTFTSLPAGSYIVVVDDTDIPSTHQQTQDPDEAGQCSLCDSMAASTVDGTAGGSDLTVDFGYQPVGYSSIGDTVYNDADADGTEDAGESGIGNITVTLYEDTNGSGTIDANDAVISTTTTADGAGSDPAGYYNFPSLIAGSYLVQVDETDTDLPNDANGFEYVLSSSNGTFSVTLGNAETYQDADYGFAAGGTVGDLVWQDTDGDGTPDSGEPGINGVTVNLYLDNDSSGDVSAGDTLVAIETTANDPNSGSAGYYSFNEANNSNAGFGLPAGSYVVEVDTSTLPNSGTGYTQTSDPDESSPPACTTCDSESSLSLALGQTDNSRDFGYQPPGVLGDQLWIDSDGSGVKEVSESGIFSVTVYLCTATPCNSGSAVSSAVTDSDGNYGFGGLADDTYFVAVETSQLPVGLVQTVDPDGTLDDLASSVVISGGSVTSIGGSGCSNCDLDIDFGYAYSGNNDVSGTVFHDDSDDGVHDGGETVVYENVNVYLYRCVGACGGGDDVLVGPTTTDSNGDYSFTGLADGNYTVVVDAGSGVLNGTDPTPTASPITSRDVDLDSTGSDTNPVSGTADFGFLSNSDLGDLPASYNITLLGSNGPSHELTSGGSVYLGSAMPDTEADGQESASANGDDTDSGTGDFDDDDGVSVNGTWSDGVDGATVSVQAVCPGMCYLAAWVDWNMDGDFNDTGEHVLLDEPVSGGSQTVTFDVPAGTFGSGSLTLNSRFRLFRNATSGTALPTGAATNGEVEDYQWAFGPTAVTLRSLTATAADYGIWLPALTMLVIGGSVVVILAEKIRRRPAREVNRQ
jgi:hypothetical protein